MNNICLIRSPKIFLLVYITLVGLIIGSCSVNDAPQESASELYITIPDPGFEQALIDQGIDSEGTIDQQLLRSDAAQVIRLDLNWSGGQEAIRNLTGIEGFTNLTKLTAAQQEIEQINLNANTRLDTLYLPGNLLQQIDLSFNKALRYLNLSTNELSSVVGLENLDQLNHMDLSWNYLEEFSISNASVKIVFLNLNELSSLNISEAVSLESLNLTSNKLTTLSIRPDSRLKTLVISDNLLQAIDLSHSPNLLYFYASSNLFESLNVSQNLDLIDLRVDRNPALTCITISPGQEIPSVKMSDYQEMRQNCE